MAGIWRDFVIAVVTAGRKPDMESLARERRRAVERLAEETVREGRRAADPPE
ncbi:hypothetical protein [Micromonospora parathelypteridis]|uniref:Uncharacterized protein n=1 Tax=Micromonospora parathelypteridis TaxID=1839617 RepID=A0A840VYW5_9ACTN|nr:hypothetical protein [Micromonospora parathelypteridis]MBB5478158.1 hypothetical protein [Micromonospora parathelypteridis]GGO07691.1 hypothetical protein GCM10011576_12510 [Micromonospora parathelypteridis]